MLSHREIQILIIIEIFYNKNFKLSSMNRNKINLTHVNWQMYLHIIIITHFNIL
jgi:hypothetical protein